MFDTFQGNGAAPPKWASGPWDWEPDEHEFEHEGVSCLMLRNEEFGHWCGYVEIEEGHLWWGRDSDDPVLEAVQAHGGVTFSGELLDNLGRYLIGFHCAHATDLTPKGALDFLDGEAEYIGVRYRGFNEVRALCQRLAVQSILAGVTWH